MTIKKARVAANITLFLFPFLFAWTIIICTAFQFTPERVFNSHVFWTPATFWWTLTAVYLLVLPKE